MALEIPTYPSEHWFYGNGLSFMEDSPSFLLDIAKEYKDEGIVQFRFANLKFAIVFDPQYVRELLVSKAAHFPKDDRDIAILSKFIGRGLVTTNGDEHKKQRRLAQPAFHAQRIASYADVMVNYTTDMLDTWLDGQTRDVSQEMFKLTMYIVCKTIFDVDKDMMAEQADRIGEAMEHLQNVTDQAFSQLVDWPEWLPTSLNRQRKHERNILYETIADILVERHTTHGELEDRGDLLSMLLRAHQDEQMSDEELRDQLITLFVAGHETTSNALTWAWYCLSQHPEIMAQLQDEVDSVLNGRSATYADLNQLVYTEMVLKEAMRLYPPAWVLNTRCANRDTTLGEYEIKEGMKLFVSPFVLHRLPQHFANPDTFDPERFSAENEPEITKYSYLPFGGGGRVCIGNSFAMMEAKLILATMVQAVSLDLIPHQTIELAPRVTLSSKHGLKMQVATRDSIPATPELVLA